MAREIVLVLNWFEELKLVGAEGAGQRRETGRQPPSECAAGFFAAQQLAKGFGARGQELALRGEPGVRT